MKYIQEHWFTSLLWLIVAVLVVLTLVRNAARIRSFIIEVGLELGKCSWPWDTRQTGFKRYKELIDSTVVVVVSSLLLAAFVTSSDFLLVQVIGFLTRYHA